MVFSAVFKVYSTVSARRFQCDVSDACQRGHIENAPHYNTIFKYLEMPGMTALLKRLVIESSLPLRSVESDFAVDSSGFTTPRFVRWFDHKYGRPKQEHDWVKVSVMCGVTTNVVTAVEVDEKKGNDSPQFRPLVRQTAENLTMGEVSADAADLSYDNMDLVAQHGAMPFIAFRSTTTAPGGGVLQSAHELGITATFWGQGPERAAEKAEEVDSVESRAWI
jgi:Transposase DDE domain